MISLLNRQPRLNGNNSVTATLLAVDIGGTKSELAIFDFVAHGYTPLTRKKYASGDFSNLPEVISSFLNSVDTVPLYASIGVAGIVEGDTAQLTNIPWRIDCSDLTQQFGFKKAILINDLTALCNAIPLLSSPDLLEIKQGRANKNEMKGVIAPGTGLGQGFLLETTDHFFARGSEGGHVDFGPVDEEQTALLAWMQRKKQPVNYEMVISGSGIPNLYDFCMESSGILASPRITREMAGKRDRTPVIINGAVGSSPCPLCHKTVDLFLSILGSEAGNLALKLYAKGGIYIGGGIMPRLVDKVSFSGFVNSFLNKGVMTDLVKDIPVHLILKRDAGLIGAARIGQQLL